MNNNQLPMLGNYFKTSLRHIGKSKINFSFKLGGLTFALTSLLVIVMYVLFQLSFDKYHKDYQQIYRVNSEWVENDSKAQYAIVPPGIGPALKESFPEVVSFVRFTPIGTTTVRYEHEAQRIFGIVQADSTLFDVLTFQFVRGDRQFLKKPGTIALMESTAQNLFKDEDPIGKSISFSDLNNRTFEVAAIIQDVPANSHLAITGVLSNDAFNNSVSTTDQWNISIDGSSTLFVKLDESASADVFQSRIKPFIEARLTKTEEGIEKEYRAVLQPLSNIYLDPLIYAEFNKKGNIIYVYVFSVLGVLLLAIASMNYVNLSIADFHKRIKEIGVRKVMGARRSQIRFQVVAEAAMICIGTLVISIGLLYLVFPFVNAALEPSLQFAMLLDVRLMILVIFIIGALAFFSTVYPAYRLAVNNPVDDLKGGHRSGKGSPIGSGLLIAQFAISVFSICATYVVGRQLDFIETRNPGYDKANTIVLVMPDEYPEAKIPVVKEELGKLPGVAGVSYSTFRIAGAGYYRDWYRVEIDGKMKRMMLNEVFFDHDFFSTMNIPIVAGRSFDPANASDSHAAFIVNETAVKEFGWNDPIGKRISYGYEEPDGEKWEGTIVGVTKDFNVYSIHKKIEPLVMRLPWSSWPGQCVHIRVNGPLDQTIERIKKKYTEILPDFLIDYRIVADMYDDQYQHERKAYAALNITMWVIVLIAAVGIFSLSVYLSMRRMKEFGIRKVLGASGAHIAGIQLNHFIKIALLANAVALPVSYWIMQTWLDEFAYRTDLNIFWFLVIAFISFSVVVISAAYSSWKSSRVNPVEIIRS